MSISHEEPISGPIVWPVEKWVGSAEIAEMFGVSRQRAYQLTSRPDFPEPMVRLKGGAVWVTADVVAWAKERDRTIHETERNPA